MADFEQDIILDADGKPIFTALDQVRKQVEAINRNVVATAKTLDLQLKNMGTMLETQSREAQQRMSQMRTLAQANNNPGFLIQDTRQRQKLGKVTTQVTEYARGLDLASNSVDGFQTRLNRLNDTIAQRGRAGRGETLTQTRQRKAWEDQKKAVVELDRALEKLQNRAGRTTVGLSDQPGAQNVASRIADTRASLFNAVRDPKRQSFLPEIGRYSEALNAADAFYNDLRGRQAARLQDERTHARAVERVEATSRDNRAAQEEKMWAERDRLRKADTASTRKRRDEEDKAWAAQEWRNKDMLSAESKKSKYLNDSTAALKQQRRAVVQLSEAEKLGLQETERLNNRGLTAAEASRGEQQRRSAEIELMKAAGQERAKEIRSVEQANTAYARSKTRLNELRTAKAQAYDPRDHAYLDRQIKGEQAYAAAVRQRRTELNRDAAAGNSRGPMQTIASPGYMGAAALRTGVYGAAAMGVYAMFDTIRGGFQYVTQLEDGLAKLQAIAGATDGQMMQLKSSILDVADSSRFSTVELVKISQNLAQAGVAASQMKEALESVVNLANASGSTPDEAVNLVTAALGAFQLQASEASRVADQMVTALNRTRLTVAQAGAAIQYVGATAYEQNIAMDELMASAAAMAQAGIKSGSTIGTGMRQFLVDLQSPSKKLQEQFESLNLSTEELDVTTRGLPAVLDSLNNSGFGAAQAYEGLETRAAAAYLVLRNNTGLIDELRLQMTEAGSATNANAAAMESFSAQWQRFKNIVGEDAESLFKPLTDGLRATFKWAADARESVKELNAETGTNQTQRWGNSLLVLRDAQGEVTFALGDSLRAFENWVNGVEEGTVANEDLRTGMAVVSERISEHTGLIAELEKEYQRLLVQEDALRGNHDRLDAETASLTSRFAELGLYLDETKSQYDSLTGAVWEFIEATQQALSADLAIRGNQLANEAQNIGAQRRKATAALSPFKNDDRLTAQERRYIDELFAGQVAGRNMSIDQYRHRADALAGAGTRKDIIGTELGDVLSRLVNAMGDFSSNFIARQINERNYNSANAARTDWGMNALLAQETAQAAITRARSAVGSNREQAVANARAAIKQGREALPGNTSPEFTRFLESQRAEFDSLEQMLKATVTPTKAEEAAEKKAAAEDKVVAFGAPLANLATSSGFGNRAAPKRGASTNHKGVDYKAAEGTAVMVTADGVVKKVAYDEDGYGNYVSVDHGAGTESRYAHMSAVNVVEGDMLTKGQQVGAVGSTGNSTGPHLHYEVRQNGKAVDPTRGSYATNNEYGENAERYQQKAERERERFQKAYDRREVKIAEDRLKAAIEDASRATTTEAFEQSVARAEGAMTELRDRLTAQAQNELDAAGLGPLDPEYQMRLMQLEEDIAKRAADYQNSIVDSIFDNAENAFEAAERAAAAAMGKANQMVAAAEARVSGLGYASMDGRVPDYMQAIAARRVGEAQEARDRTRYETALPLEIGRKTQALSAAEAQLALMARTDSAYEEQRAKVDELRLSLRDLRVEQEALGIALNMAEEMPKTLGEGLEAAVENFREVNNLNRNLTDEIIYNLGGALDQAHSGFQQFFTDIFTGSKSALGAFGDMAMGMLRYLQQLAAQFVAKQIFSSILSLVGFGAGAAGGSVFGASQGATQGVASAISTGGLYAYRGGKNDASSYHRIKGYLSGGKVTDGYRSHDSVTARLAKDEWVVNSRAVDSVGDDFMADLNRRGSMAVKDASSGPTQMFQMPRQETNVYVVPPEQRPSLGKNDVLVIMDDHMVNGPGRKLIKTVAQGG